MTEVGETELRGGGEKRRKRQEVRERRKMVKEVSFFVIYIYILLFAFFIAYI